MPKDWQRIFRPSTAKSPALILKDQSAAEDLGLKGGPVRPVEGSWRKRSGQRITFGAPKGGWPQFLPDGTISKEGKNADIPRRETEVDGPEN